MHPVSGAQLNHILSLLDSGHSAHHISSLTGLHHTTISRLQRKHHPYQQKVSAGCPPKLSETDTCYAQHLITSRKAENASQITQILQEVTNQSLTSQTTRNHLKKAGLKAVVKAKSPFSLKGIGGRGWILHWLIRTGLWRTGRLLYGLMKPKSTGWGQMEGYGLGKRQGRA